MSYLSFMIRASLTNDLYQHTVKENLIEEKNTPPARVTLFL